MLLVPELDVHDEEAEGQNDPEAGHDAQGGVDGDVDTVGFDPDYGPVLGRPVPHPEHLAAPLEVQGARHPAVLADAVLHDRGRLGIAVLGLVDDLGGVEAAVLVEVGHDVGVLADDLLDHDVAAAAVPLESDRPGDPLEGGLIHGADKEALPYVASIESIHDYDKKKRKQSIQQSTFF